MLRKSVLIVSIAMGAGLAGPSLGAKAGAQAASFGREERLACQRRLEEARWRLGAWPGRSARPSLDEVLPEFDLSRKADRGVLASLLLEQRYGIRLDSARLREEAERMVRDTRAPDVLQELFTALDDDPQVIEECLARPILAERLLRNAFAEGRPGIGFDEWWVEASRAHAAEAAAFAIPRVARERLPAIVTAPCASDLWSPTTLTNAPVPRADASVIWTGTELIVWGGFDTQFLVAYNTGGRYDPATDSWTPTSVIGAPSARHFHGAVWTGTRMIVWAGQASGVGINTGGVYDPITDVWTPMSMVNVPSARWSPQPVWTGSEMIVWGGNTSPTPPNTGGRYDPQADTWTATSLTNAPQGRFLHSAVWTGSEMIVWGGATLSSGGNIRNTGGRYDPVQDVWVATSVGAGVPSGRRAHAGVWTGTEMIVWGGIDSSSDNPSTGGRYNPVSDTWTPTANSGSVPQGRAEPAVAWLNGEMILWGGDRFGVEQKTGARYFPSTDSWLPIPISATTPSARRRFSGTSVAAPQGVFSVWGGVPLTATGGIYCACPATIWYPDADGDGRGRTLGALHACAPPAGYASIGGDCDDADPARYPGNPEICDLKDNDCNALVDDLPPPSANSLSMERVGADAVLTWTVAAGADTHDVSRGRIDTLRATSGSFAASTDACLVNDSATTSASDPELPVTGEAFWYVARGSYCGVEGSYDDPSGSGQAGSRDAGIDASAAGCP